MEKNKIKKQRISSSLIYIDSDDHNKKERKKATAIVQNEE